MSSFSGKEPTLSIRLLWPFARVVGAEPAILADLGLNRENYGDPDFRLPHRVAIDALVRSVALAEDPTLGLRAGDQTDHGDFTALEYAARSAQNLHEAITMMNRYMRILDDFMVVSLGIEGELCHWRHRPKDGSTLPAAANDYVVAASLSFARRNMENYVPPASISLMHERPAYAAEYERCFQAPVHFGAPHNAVSFPAAWLAFPMHRANRGVAAAFDVQVQRVLDRLEAGDGVSGKVRAALPDDLKIGPPNMQHTARRLGMGVATLRRRLEEEGTTFSDLVNAVRQEMATRHLSEVEPTVSEVAFLLGFSDVRAFGRAFRRWTGRSPTEYRVGER